VTAAEEEAAHEEEEEEGETSPQNETNETSDSVTSSHME